MAPSLLLCLILVLIPASAQPPPPAAGGPPVCSCQYAVTLAPFAYFLICEFFYSVGVYVAGKIHKSQGRLKCAAAFVGCIHFVVLGGAFGSIYQTGPDFTLRPWLLAGMALGVGLLGFAHVTRFLSQLTELSTGRKQNAISKTQRSKAHGKLDPRAKRTAPAATTRTPQLDP